MRTIVLTLLAGAAIVPNSASAQEWTAAELEVISLTQDCWTAWAEEDMAGVESACPDHPEAAGWSTAEDVPVVGWSEKNVRRWMQSMFPRTEPVFWEIRPQVVKIFGDTALYHFWALWTEEGPDGQLNTWTRKQLDVWQRIEGQWYWIGGTQAQTTGD